MDLGLEQECSAHITYLAVSHNLTVSDLTVSYTCPGSADQATFEVANSYNALLRLGAGNVLKTINNPGTTISGTEEDVEFKKGTRVSKWIYAGLSCNVSNHTQVFPCLNSSTIAFILLDMV